MHRVYKEGGYLREAIITFQKVDIPTTTNRKMMIATTKVMMAGTKKHHAHGGSGILVLAQIDGMYVPRMFPSGVCAYQRPRSKPRLQKALCRKDDKSHNITNYNLHAPQQSHSYDKIMYRCFPNQCPTMATTAGKPVA